MVIAICCLLCLLASAGPAVLLGHYLRPTIREKREIKQNFRDISDMEYVPAEWQKDWRFPAEWAKH